MLNQVKQQASNYIEWKKKAIIKLKAVNGTCKLWDSYPASAFPVSGRDGLRQKMIHICA